MPLTIIEFLSSNQGDSTRNLYWYILVAIVSHLQHAIHWRVISINKQLNCYDIFSKSHPPILQKKTLYTLGGDIIRIDGNFQEKDFLCRKRSLKIAAAEKREKGREGRPWINLVVGFLPYVLLARSFFQSLHEHTMLSHYFSVILCMYRWRRRMYSKRGVCKVKIGVDKIRFTYSIFCSALHV